MSMALDRARLARALSRTYFGVGEVTESSLSDAPAIADEYERPCSCDSTETRELCQGDQCITVCAECESDEP